MTWTRLRWDKWALHCGTSHWKCVHRGVPRSCVTQRRQCKVSAVPCWLCTGIHWLQEGSLRSPLWITGLHHLWLWSFTEHEVPKGAAVICGLMCYYRLALFSLHCNAGYYFESSLVWISIYGRTLIFLHAPQGLCWCPVLHDCSQWSVFIHFSFLSGVQSSLLASDTYL